MKFFYISLFTALFLVPSIAKAQIGEDAEDIFNELRALDGTWFMPTERGDRLEIWRILNDSTYLGRDVRIKPENGDTVLLETIRLERRDTTITYTVTARGQNNNKPVVFTLTAADEDGYLFENPNHDDPKKIRYRLLSNREIQVTLDGERNGRPNRIEYVFEREFTPSSVQFRARIGANYYNQRRTGFFNTQTGPAFSGGAGAEIGGTAAFKGRGGYISINLDLGISLKRSGVNSLFYSDTNTYKRDLTYNMTWLSVAAIPEFTFKRDGKFSLIAGPYIAFQMSNSAIGDQTPESRPGNAKLRAHNDLKKVDIGLVGGMQYKLNLGKKDLDGLIGLRVNYGLANVDNLYVRACENNPSLCNGRVSLQGISLYYSINLLKL